MVRVARTARASVSTPQTSHDHEWLAGGACRLARTIRCQAGDEPAHGLGGRGEIALSTDRDLHAVAARQQGPGSGHDLAHRRVAQQVGDQARRPLLATR